MQQQHKLGCALPLTLSLCCQKSHTVDPRHQTPPHLPFYLYYSQGKIVTLLLPPPQVTFKQLPYDKHYEKDEES